MTPADWVIRPSPHHSPRRDPITAIVLHADAAPQIESTLNWLANPISKVSYHLVIGRGGTVYSVVPVDRVAWHAGASMLDGDPRVNSISVGVSLSNRNDGREPYPIAQVDAAVAVCAYLCRTYHIPVDRITTHAIVATPKGRKNDPLGLDLAAFRASVAAMPAVA